MVKRGHQVRETTYLVRLDSYICVAGDKIPSLDEGGGSGDVASGGAKKSGGWCKCALASLVAWSAHPPKLMHCLATMMTMVTAVMIESAPPNQ